MRNPLHQNARQSEGSGAKPAFRQSYFLRGRAVLTGVEVFHRIKAFC